MNIENFYSTFFKVGKVSIDSRKIERGDVFFAFTGENFNAATLAENAINQGASAVIVEDEVYANSDKNIFLVPSTLEFLQKLALYHRQQLNIPIIALTGSNGKTTTKELINAVLAQKFKTQYTFGNLNNHIGVPLTLLSIDEEYEIAVVEMGANHQKEIELLCSLAKPNFGYITNFGKAHLEGFGGFEGVIKGKSELYDYLIQNEEFILVNEADEIQREKTNQYAKKITFGAENSQYQFEKFVENNRVGLVFNGEKAQSNLTGGYNFTNLCAATSLGLHFGISFSEIKKAIETYVPTNMRSQIVEKEGKTLVLDTYNANPSSMALSLKNFSEFQGTKTIIIGDMLELGEEGKREHQQILDLAEQLGFDEIISVGGIFKEIHHQGKAFSHHKELIEYLKENPIHTKNILLKGSRGITLEKVLEFL
ncbi:MAG: UDP-N-acetylmuramoyl-tripeptide--D-alanyl-D-alanine ligase [Flavobacteriaceae bacterium]|nr:UDP-N-acetylmuramoyl-tripeptide--D-alanyl-D-alanine ligase [Flavobacteriaceae bacterium]